MLYILEFRKSIKMYMPRWAFALTIAQISGMWEGFFVVVVFFLNRRERVVGYS